MSTGMLQSQVTQKLLAACEAMLAERLREHKTWMSTNTRDLRDAVAEFKRINGDNSAPRPHGFLNWHDDKDGGIGVMLLDRKHYERLCEQAAPSTANFLASLGFPKGCVIGISPHVEFMRDRVWLKIQDLSIPKTMPGDKLPELEFIEPVVEKAPYPRHLKSLPMKERIAEVKRLMAFGALTGNEVRRAFGLESDIPFGDADAYSLREVMSSAEMTVLIEVCDSTSAAPPTDVSSSVSPMTCKPAACDCGGATAGTTHSSWCSSLKKETPRNDTLGNDTQTLSVGDLP